MLPTKRCLDSIIFLVSVAEQDGLSLTWSETPTTGFLVTLRNGRKTFGRIGGEFEMQSSVSVGLVICFTEAHLILVHLRNVTCPSIG